MSKLLVHDMDTAWTSSDATLLSVATDARTPFAESTASNRLQAELGSSGTSASFSPASPIDLSEYSELRIWIRANAAATGSSNAPFYFDFGFQDAGDLPGEEHRWLVSVNRPNAWLRRRFGIENERRSAITQFDIRSLSDAPFTVFIDHVLAVEEELLADVENAMVELIDIGFPSTTGVPTTGVGTAGSSQISVADAAGFAPGNRVLLSGGTAGDEIHHIESIATSAISTPTISFAPGDTLIGDIPPGSTLTLLIPLVFDIPDDTDELPNPAIVVSSTDVREDLERAAYFTQRDSFRALGDLVVCSTRPAPRPYMLDYQLTVQAQDRVQHRTIHSRLVGLLSGTQGLRVNGDTLTLEMLPPPDLSDARGIRQVAPVYVRINSTLEVAPRATSTVASAAAVAAAHLAAPTDFETVTIDL